MSALARSGYMSVCECPEMWSSWRLGMEKNIGCGACGARGKGIELVYQEEHLRCVGWDPLLSPKVTQCRRAGWRFQGGKEYVIRPDTRVIIITSATPREPRRCGILESVMSLLGTRIEDVS